MNNPAYIYLAHDHLGTVRQWRFANKNSARAIEYDPYGNIYGQSGFVNMPSIYALHEFDFALKQYRTPFRQYRPIMARWTTPDPLGMIDGPNRYAYVGGRVVIALDRLGLLRDCDAEHIDSFNACYEGAAPWPCKYQDHCHYAYCQTKCLVEYMACLADNANETLCSILPPAPDPYTLMPSCKVPWFCDQ